MGDSSDTDNTLAAISDRLRGSSSKSQTEALVDVARLLDDDSDQQDRSFTKSILPRLLATYTRSFEGTPRRAAHSVLRKYIRNYQWAWKEIAQFISEESHKLVVAPISSFVLLEWCALIQEEIDLNEPQSKSVLLDVSEAAALVLDKCLKVDVRNGLRHAAHVTARRGLRAVVHRACPEYDPIKEIITRLTTDKATAANAPYIGIAASVAGQNPATAAKFALLSGKIIDLYLKQIISSKGPLPVQQVRGLDTFWTEFAKEEEVSESIMPAVEKAILRSPENVLQGPIVALAQSLPQALDLSQLVLTKLVKPFISSMNSTNPIIRSGAVDSLSSLLLRKQGSSLDKIVIEILSNIKSAKAASYELRGLLSDVLNSIKLDKQVSATIVQGLAPIAAKEANESALRRETNALSIHLVTLVESGKVDKTVSDIVLKGCAEKRPLFKKIWLLSVGSTLLHARTLSQESQDFVTSALKVLQDILSEHSANPLPAAQSGIISTAFVVPALFRAPAVKVNTSIDTFLQPQSVLLSSKVYSRLQSAEDQRWALHALLAVTCSLNTAAKEVKTAWARGVIHLLLSPESDTSTRKTTGIELAKAFYDEPAAVGSSIILGLWDVLHEIHERTGKIDQTARAYALERVIKCITPTKRAWQIANREFPQEVLENQAASTVVLLGPELIQGGDWIQNCLLLGVDPGQLAKKKSSELMQEILSHFQTSNMARLTVFENAACQAAANLAFVAPDVLAPLLIQQLSSDLEPSQLVEVGQTEAAIARTPEGVLYVDPLAKSNGTVENKNAKDYNVLKWEEELRAQIAQKKGAPQKKLTPDQQAKVNAQTELEKQVRTRVREVSSRLRRGAGFVHALAVGPPTEARLWMSPAIDRIEAALHAGAALIVDDELVSAYLACANHVQERIGNLRPFIGVATLRAIGQVGLSENLEVEPLAELGTRVLYRLRFASEQRPFDTASLAYSLPLVFSILDNGGIGKSSVDDADAQVLLALEFLSFQMSSCVDTLLPRVDILRRLITSMQKYPQHYRLLKDSLIVFSQSVASNINPAERDVLLQAVTLPEETARSAALQAIQSELVLSEMEYSVHVWIACQDEEDDNAETALAIWEENEFSVGDELINTIPDFLFDKARSTRTSAAKALAHALEVKSGHTTAMRTRLQTSYHQEAQPIVPKRDKFGIVQKGDLTDQWEKRSGLALAFKEMAAVFEEDDTLQFMDFLISDGALADRNSVVRAEMVEAGTSLVSSHGKECLEPLMQLFETILQGPDKATQESDWTNEAVIVLYGSLAQHLPRGDKRLKTVLSKLIDTLSTPSESVQYAVAGCMPALVRTAGSDADSYINSLLDQLFQSKKYAARRGAAYGLAGFVKGKGLGALRQFRIMSALHSATENKKSPEHREGALFAYELLSTIVGRTFEPYVIEVLPQLLSCFGDPSSSVREACLDTAKACFASLSSYGVQQVLPRLLEGLDETQWRSKKGACDLLGAMAYLDPQQLATSLPEIIPPLTAVLTDTHKEVRAAANNSLKRFGEVISNPEVKSLVDILLKALSDPTKYTDEALDSLIRVSFIHYLDAPSLALVVRILERGLNDRSSTKRKAAQIIGSLAHLTEKRDIVTHLPILVSGLRGASIDPVPATRATASKALGSLVEKLGEDAFPDLIPSLMSSLRTDTGAGDRLGSAQALSEVLAGLGTSRLEETLPTILQNVQSTRSAVREGFMTLFIFLPACFGNSFANYLGQIIPSILSGLADDIEAIRDIALRAGRLLVKNFATKAIDLLLPELQRGLADDSYRIRLSSVELVGDLLFSLTGLSGKTEADEEDESAAQAGQSLLEVLGEDKRNRVLSSLYICRCDTSGLVRAAAINVWKALVATPRTLREIVPTLTQMIIARLGSSNMEHKVIAGNALGEVIRKAGDNIFTSLLPSLEEELRVSTDPDNRQGICIALREVVNAASTEALAEHEKRLVSIVRLALVDPNADVREAAAESFDALQQMYGKRIIDQVLPSLLNLLRSDDADSALSALLTLLTEDTRANVILPNLIPTLLTDPVTVFNARALASLAEVGGSSMNRRLPAIFNTLSDNIVFCKDEEREKELNAAFTAVLCSVDEYDGLNTAMSVMLAMMKHDDHRKRAVAAHQLGLFFGTTDVDYSRYNQDLIRVLLISFDDRDKAVVKEAWGAMSQLQVHLRKEEMESLAQSTANVLKQVGTAGHNLPGFALPKGIQPVLAIFLQALLNGSSDQKLHAANGISDIIDRTSADSLKLFVTQITGPLIRVSGERAVDVKCAIIVAINQLLDKIPTFLRPFLPQLQRTLTKSIADPTSEVLRTRAVRALGTLITLTPRIDPLIAELVTGVKTPDSGVRNAMMKALQEVVSKVGGNMSEQSRDAILGLMDSQSGTEDDMMITLARLLGALIKVLPAATASGLIKSRVLVQPPTNPSILALNAVLAESAKTLIPGYASETCTVVVNAIQSRTALQHHGVLAAGKLLLSNIEDQESNRLVFEALASKLTPANDIDTRRLILVVLRTVSRHHNEETQRYLQQIAYPVYTCLRDAVIPIKLAAEAAFLELFDVVNSDSEVWDKYIAEVKASDAPIAPGVAPSVVRIMGDYFKRVALRLAAQKREQREAEGGAGGLGLSSDEAEDEKEVWSVGKVDLGETGKGFED